MRLTFDIETIPNPIDPSSVLGQERDRLEQRAIADNREFMPAVMPAFARIVCVGIKAVGDAGTVKDFAYSGPNEVEILKQFWQVISECQSRNPLYVGWNSLDFDAPMLITRSLVNTILPVKHFCNLRRFSSSPHYDVMQWLSSWQGRSTMSLRTASALFGFPDPKEVVHNPGTAVPTMVANGEWRELESYCLGDVDATDRLFSIVRPVLG